MADTLYDDVEDMLLRDAYKDGQVVRTQPNAPEPEALDDLVQLINSDLGPDTHLIWHFAGDGSALFKCLAHHDEVKARLETYFRN